jgi:hypothetical protein
VYRLAYNGDVSAGQLAVFQGASEAPISGSIRAEPGSCRTEKQPIGRGPKGCVENGVGGCVARRLCIDLDMRPPTASPARTALPAAHFERNEVIIICETVHYFIVIRSVIALSTPLRASSKSPSEQLLPI